ncbi:MAG: SDR family oxidoreductase [Chloroflexota bacterium]
MDLGLKGKVALVAAASKGLGKAAALALAGEGALVAICGRTANALQAAAAEIEQASGSPVMAVVADVGRADDVERLAEAVAARFGQLDILVTNAGGPPAGHFSSLDDNAWQQAFELTLMSTVRLCRAALPHMQKNGWGRIVNITSVSVKQPIDNLLLSNALRTGVVGLAKTLSAQFAGWGITVNCVCPGWTLTDRVAELLAAQAQARGITPQEAEAQITADIPMARMGRPEELAALIAFLASEQAGYITGAAIQVDGGYVRGLF